MQWGVVRERTEGWEEGWGIWLEVLRCRVNERHLVYFDVEVETVPDPGVAGEEIWCPWGDGGVLERVPNGLAEMVVTGAVGARTEPTR